MRVRANNVYQFEPVPWDRLDPPYGVKAGILRAGDKVRVVKCPGCPPPNTMRHCHIETLDGRFAGLVHTNSLNRPRKWPNMCGG
jgi:hypothetical protein